jgi:hypothetical protein
MKFLIVAAALLAASPALAEDVSDIELLSGATICHLHRVMGTNDWSSPSWESRAAACEAIDRRLRAEGGEEAFVDLLARKLK